MVSDCNDWGKVLCFTVCCHGNDNCNCATDVTTISLALTQALYVLVHKQIRDKAHTCHAMVNVLSTKQTVHQLTCWPRRWQRGSWPGETWTLRVRPGAVSEGYSCAAPHMPSPPPYTPWPRCGSTCSGRGGTKTRCIMVNLCKWGKSRDPPIR